MDLKDFNNDEIEKLLNSSAVEASEEDVLHNGSALLIYRVRARKLDSSKNESVKKILNPDERNVLSIAFQHAVARWSGDSSIEKGDFSDKSKNAQKFINIVIDDLYEGIKFFEAAPDTLISVKIKERALVDFVTYLETGEYLDEYESTILPFLAHCVKKSSDSRKGII